MGFKILTLKGTDNSTHIDVDQTDGLILKQPKTDLVRFIDISQVMAIGGTWTATRSGDNNVFLRKTAAAETTYLVTSLRNLFKTTTNKGVRVKAVNVVYGVGTAALVSNVATLSNVLYTNNTAVSVSAHGGTVTGSLATATQANPYVSSLTLGTQTFEVTANQDVRLQLAINSAATSVFDLYGIFVTFDQNLF